MAQGFHWVWRSLLLLALGGWFGTAQAAACTGAGHRLLRVAPEVWWLAGEPGDSSPENQGVVSNLLAVRQGQRLWLVGAGPSPRVGATVACRLREATGLRVTDLVLPWPRAELTLGAAAFPGARRWAHADVAATMAIRCPRCVERMRQRLGPRAVALGRDPVRQPNALLRGDHGRLGPFLWWRSARSVETPVLLLQVRGRPWFTAHGLLWGDGPPDLRDADAPVIQARLSDWLAWLPPDAKLLPEQGEWLARSAVLADVAYLQALDVAVSSAQSAGALETELPSVLPGVAPAMTQHWRHGLNWQRRWLQMEAAP